MDHDIKLKRGDHNTDANGSIQDQLDSLNDLQDHQAEQAENQDQVTRKAGGLHSAESLRQHLEKANGPRFSGHAKPFGRQ